MSAVLAGICCAAVAGGFVVFISGAQRRADSVRVRRRDLRRRAPAFLRGESRRAQRNRTILFVAVGAGVLVWLITGWVVAVVAIPAGTLVARRLLQGSDNKRVIQRLDAMEEWTRSMAGVITVGSGLEQAIMATGRSAPTAIAPEISTLIGRLRARWSTPEALRAFADDLDDITGDLIAAQLVLGAERRGPGLSRVLEDLAESVSEEVRARRDIESDRSKPRATARWVTIIALAVIGLFMLQGSYVAPYGTPLGQVALVFLSAAFLGCLFWMDRSSRLEQPARFIFRRHSKGTEASTS